MEVKYESFLSSQPFLIEAPNGRTFFVHGDLIAQHSEVLAASVNGSMKEAETHVIQIKDIDGDIDDGTVMRFIEFAYRGDYTVPEPDTMDASDDIKVDQTSEEPKTSQKDADHDERDDVPSAWAAEEEPPPAPDEPIAEEPAYHDSWGFGTSSAKKKRNKSTRQSIWYEEGTVEEPSPSHSRMIKKTTLWSQFRAQAKVIEGVRWEPPANKDPRQNFTPVFECHARLYVFSNRYACNSLKELSLQKLRLTLSRFKLHEERYSDITHLIRYSYDHTTNFDDRTDELRSLVSDYVICHFEEISSVEGFMDWFHECDGLPKDLMIRIKRRLD